MPEEKPRPWLNAAKFVIAAGIVLGHLGNGSLDLFIPTNAEQFGFVFFNLVSYVFAGWFFYSAYKSSRT